MNHHISILIQVENPQNPGCEDVIKKTVIVEPCCDKPKVKINVKPRGCKAAQIVFGNKKLNYTVDWGDGTIDNGIWKKDKLVKHNKIEILIDKKKIQKKRS